MAQPPPSEETRRFNTYHNPDWVTGRPVPRTGTSALFQAEFGQILASQSPPSVVDNLNLPSIVEYTTSSTQTDPGLWARDLDTLPPGPLPPVTPQRLSDELRNCRNSVFMDFGKLAIGANAYDQDVLANTHNPNSIRDSEDTFTMIFPDQDRRVQNESAASPAPQQELREKDMEPRPSNTHGKQRADETFHDPIEAATMSDWREQIESGIPMEVGGPILGELGKLGVLATKLNQTLKLHGQSQGLIANVQAKFKEPKMFVEMKALMAAMEQFIERSRETAFVKGIEAGSIQKCWKTLSVQFVELAARLHVATSNVITVQCSKRQKVRNETLRLLEYMGSMCYDLERLIRSVEMFVGARTTDWVEIKEELLEDYNRLKPYAGVIVKGAIVRDEATKKLAGELGFVGRVPESPAVGGTLTVSQERLVHPRT